MRQLRISLATLLSLTLVGCVAIPEKAKGWVAEFEYVGTDEFPGRTVQPKFAYHFPTDSLPEAFLAAGPVEARLDIGADGYVRGVSIDRIADDGHSGFVERELRALEFCYLDGPLELRSHLTCSDLEHNSGKQAIPHPIVGYRIRIHFQWVEFTYRDNPWK